MKYSTQVQRRIGYPAMLFSLAFALLLLSHPCAAQPSGAIFDGVFHWVYVDGTENIDGSQTGFEYLCQTGSATRPLLFHLQGAGACQVSPFLKSDSKMNPSTGCSAARATR